MSHTVLRRTFVTGSHALKCRGTLDASAERGGGVMGAAVKTIGKSRAGPSPRAVRNLSEEFVLTKQKMRDAWAHVTHACVRAQYKTV